jgi:hypothetical protein
LESLDRQITAYEEGKQNDDFIIAANDFVRTRMSSLRLTYAAALLQRHASGVFTKPALTGFNSTYRVYAKR